MVNNMTLSEYLIDTNSSILDAVQQIDRNSKGIVYVANRKELVGVITDGDVRRYLLKGGNLNDNVLKIANMRPIYMKEGNEKNVYEEMKNSKIRSIPIINSSKQIIKIYFDDELVEKKKHKLNIPVVIMAGGKGTRLYPYTQILPKPLIPIGDKTITEHIMDRFKDYGCDKFTMIVNYKKHFIMSYFDDNDEKSNVEFIEETEFLGTGGGLKLLDGRVDSTMFMTNCDILIDEDYAKIIDFHRSKKNIITIVCAKKNMVIPYGTVEMTEEGCAMELKEKPELSFLTNTGFYVMEPEFIKEIPDNCFVHITDIIQKCIDRGKRVGVYTIQEENWLDMGQLEELVKMKEKLNVN